MKRPHWIAAAMAVGVLAAAGGASAGVQAASGSGPPAPIHCPRACMISVMDQYLDALVRHDPSGLPLSKGVRFTENTEEIKLSEGLWVSASKGPTSFKVYAADPASSQVVFYGVMEERSRPIQIVVRLKLINGRITEIEHVINRGTLSPAAMANLQAPRAALLADVPAAERTPREVMINAADDYFEAIEHQDGSRAPFARDCDRRENGSKTTNNNPPVPWPVPLGSPEADKGMATIGSMGCAAQLDTGVMAFITRLWPRRIDVVDEEKGLVITFVMFNHRGGFRDLPIKGVEGVTSLPLGGASSSMQMAEMFKIRGGQIHEVEAIGFALPYGAKSGWEAYGQ
jgi:hypothetical protein